MSPPPARTTRTCGGPGNTGTTAATCRSSQPRADGRSGSRPLRPGREHDSTCARTHGLVQALDRLAATLGIPTLTDLGYENIGDGFRHPVKKPQGGKLTEEQRAFNAVIRGVHGVAERANALLKVTFKALRRVTLDPSAITRIARAALVVLQLEHGRTT